MSKYRNICNKIKDSFVSNQQKINGENDTRTQEITVYKFEELSEDAKEKAKNYCISNWIDENDYAELDYFKAMLEEKGFRDPKISWSGFCSQGDGASFTCDFIDIEEYFKAYNLTDKDKNHKMFLAAWKKDWIENIKIHRTDSRYYHENTIDISWTCNLKKFSSAWIEDIFEKIIQDILNDAKDLSREIYRGLEKQYEYCTSYEYTWGMSSSFPKRNFYLCNYAN